MATPTAAVNSSPITDANKGANHQAVRSPTSTAFLPSHFNPVPVAADIKGGLTATAYSATISAQGGTGPYTFAVTSGTLPTGTSLNSATGVISGTPTVAAGFIFTITVTDSLGFPGSQTFTITVAAPSGGGGGSYTFIA